MLAAATLLAVGIALIAVGAVRALNMLEAAEVDRAPTGAAEASVQIAT